MLKNKILKKSSRNNTVYKQLVSEYFIKATSSLDDAAETSKKIYNCALYIKRQAFFKHKIQIPYAGTVGLNAIFKRKAENRESLLYRMMPYAQSAQKTLKEVDTVWYAWFQALKAYKKNPHRFSGRPKAPKYLRGRRHTFYVTNQNAKVKNGVLTIKKLNFKLKLAPGIKKIKRVVFVPVSGGYKVIVPYDVTELQKNYLEDNGNYMGIDPGVDNAFACVTNTGDRPLLINGRPAKSVNQFYNKKLARLKREQAQYHQLERMINTRQGPKAVYDYTKAMIRLTDWRNQKLREFAHKASKRIIDYALSCGVNTIIIGKNNSWKRSSNMGKKNNQNFVGLPHAKMIDMITYKANMVGITVITTNESYTSQTSALDNEKPCWNNGNKSRKKQGKSPANRRIHRGMFKTNKGILVNADVNGAMQIIRKVFPDVRFDLTDRIVGAVSRPLKKWSPQF